MRPIVRAMALLIPVCVLVVGCVDCTIGAGETRVCGSGRIVEIERDIPRVTGVHLSTFGDLKIAIGEHEKFVIEAEDNIVDLIETRIKGRILEIGTRRHVSLKPKKRVRYYLTVRELDTVVISSSGDIFAPYVETEDFEVKISSSGDLVIKGVEAADMSVKLSSSGDADIGSIDAKELDVRISSSGDLTIDDGKARFQNIHISSSGDYNAPHVVSDNAHVTLSSSGDAHIHVDGKLNASLSSSGSIYYSGDATATVRASSSGRVRHIGN